MIMDQEKIKAVLPHREPFLFIDKVVEIEGTQRIVAVKHVLDDAYYFKGHFPGNPIMPGVLIIEAMAQASVILYSIDRPHISKSKPDYYLGKVKADFLAPVNPGDELTIEVNKFKFLDNAAITDTVAKVNDKIIAKAQLIFSIQKADNKR
jgi:3-hydroxyacyl-[acyl-carrier-protein] dehydratase